MAKRGRKKKVAGAARIVARAKARRGAPGRLIVVAGPSGVGKMSLCKAALDELPRRLRWSVSHTTRPRRKGERQGREYYFVGQREFRRLLLKDAFVEHAVVHGNRYGTSKAELRRIQKTGADALLEIDVQGALQVIRQFPDAVTVFILPPSLAVLRRRLAGRGTESPAVIGRRIANAEGEIAKAPRFAYHVVNDAFDEALLDLVAIIWAEGCRAPAGSIAKKH